MQRLTHMQEQLGAWRPPPSRQDQLLSQLQQVQGELEQHQRENGWLKDRLGYVEACLALLDCEVGRAVQRRIGLGAAGDNNGPATFPLLRPVNRLNPQGELAGTAWPHGRKPQVSVWALPALGSWDATWDQHARELSTLDLVLLHRQALQEMAVMLPRAQLRGPASPDAERLRCAAALPVQTGVLGMQATVTAGGVHVAKQHSTTCSSLASNSATLPGQKSPCRAHLPATIPTGR